MKYHNDREERVAGYYWWLPEYLKDQPEDPNNWTIVPYHPENKMSQKVGIFYGPIPVPTFKK